MQLVVNHQLVKQKARLGKIATGIGVLALGVGFLSSLRMSAPDQQPEWGIVAGSYAVLIIALGALSIGRYHLSRWARHPRADEVLAESLKGFDSRYHLMSYIPGLPVDHLLVTPHGLVLFIVRNLAGDIRARGNRWSRKFSLSQLFGGYSDGSLGNPANDAARAVAAMRELLNRNLGTAADEVPISAAIVFTDRRASIKVENTTVPVVAPDELQNHVRTLHKDSKLSRETMEQVVKMWAHERPALEAQAVKQRPKRRRRAGKPAPVVDQSKLGRNRAERRMR